MKHLIVCREYPPAPIPPGGIGTYVLHMAQLLADSGETVHVIAQLWRGAAKRIEEKCHGRLVIHRVPMDDWDSFLLRNPFGPETPKHIRGLFQSSFPSQCFSWQAGRLAEKLVEDEGIDIIEAQDWEAPLYYFQLRRALGFGPKQRPPCIVHLHSPTEFITRYNDADIGKPEFLTSKRLEDYSIGAADALLCPSRYLTRQVEAHYGLPEKYIQVIPYPLGDTKLLSRDTHTWDRGTVCYMGRLERRKGIIEWIDAAVSVAPQHPFAVFEFLGTNVLGTQRMSGEKFLQNRIPEELRARFIFHGAQKRASLPHFLIRARMAVVPSRWENFPNTCVEAMSSGLPVIASPEGGMAEMIRDGVTGWLAEDARSEGLAKALTRALETSPTALSEMGYRAASDIREMCDNKKILEQHVSFRKQLMARGSKHSLHLPPNLPSAKRRLVDRKANPRARNGSAAGVVIVVTYANAGGRIIECLDSIKRQLRKPLAVVIADVASSQKHTKALNQACWDGWEVIEEKTGNLAMAKNAAIETVLRGGLQPLGFAFLSVDSRLAPEFVITCESVLERCPEVGLLSCWVERSDTAEKLWIRPCPSFPYQWVSNDVAPVSVIRTEALRAAHNFRPCLSGGYEEWDIFNAVMAADWVAVTIPEVLAHCHAATDPDALSITVPEHARCRRELLERFPELIARDAKDIVLLAESATNWALRGEVAVLREKLARIRMMARNPVRAVFSILRHTARRVLQFRRHSNT